MPHLPPIRQPPPPPRTPSGIGNPRRSAGRIPRGWRGSRTQPSPPARWSDAESRHPTAPVLTPAYCPAGGGETTLLPAPIRPSRPGGGGVFTPVTNSLGRARCKTGSEKVFWWDHDDPGRAGSSSITAPAALPGPPRFCWPGRSPPSEPREISSSRVIRTSVTEERQDIAGGVREMDRLISFSTEPSTPDRPRRRCRRDRGSTTTSGRMDPRATVSPIAASGPPSDSACRSIETPENNTGHQQEDQRYHRQ